MIVFDLDGTLRNNASSEHLVPKDVTNNVNWHDWQHYVNNHSTPIESTVRLFNRVCSDTVVLTSSQFGTASWLYRHGIFPAEIIERHYDDHRTPFDYKLDFITRHCDQIVLWVDDDIKVLEYVESLGIPTVRVNSGH